MSIEVKMPALSPTMEKGTLARWLVAEGDLVKIGDLVAEVETDKATMEVEAVDEGRVAQLTVPAGSENVPVGTVIAVLVDADTSVAVPVLEEASASVAGPAEAAPPPPASAAPERIEAATPAPSAPAPQSDTPAPSAAPSPAPRRLSPADRIKVSPLAQRIAEAKGIDLAGIAGTGPNGRIVRADLGLKPLIAPTSAPAPAASAPVAATIAPPPQGVPVETVKLSGMRKTIARRLSESKQKVPHFYITVRCNLDALLALRTELNGALAAQGVKLSVNDFLIKALGRALIQVPDANVQFAGDELHRFSRADISMAVAVEGGLVTPVIKDVGNLSLSAIARTSKAVAEKAREGRLTPEDYQGGTASISNLGMFGIDEMFPVINPPQAVILGTAAGVEQPWKVGDGIGLATIMAATASFDHRAIDGAIGAQLLQAFREFVESPLLLCA